MFLVLFSRLLQSIIAQNTVLGRSAATPCDDEGGSMR